jgi:mono/diheme cytochrome c family protein
MCRIALLGVVLVLAGCGSSRHTSSPVAEAEAALCAGQADQRCAQLRRIEAWHASRDVEAGAVAFVRAGCASCHTYRDLGPRFPSAPDLTHEGARRDRAYVVELLRCPACLQPGSGMPGFGQAPRAEVDRIVDFVLESR